MSNLVAAVSKNERFKARALPAPSIQHVLARNELVAASARVLEAAPRRVVRHGVNVNSLTRGSRAVAATLAALPFLQLCGVAQYLESTFQPGERRSVAAFVRVLLQRSVRQARTSAAGRRRWCTRGCTCSAKRLKASRTAATSAPGCKHSSAYGDSAAAAPAVLMIKCRLATSSDAREETKTCEDGPYTRG